MNTLNRVLKKITEKPTLKTELENKVTGFKLSKVDRKNIQILLKRMYVEFNPNASNNDLLRTFLSETYKAENHFVKMSKAKKKSTKLSKTKTDSMTYSGYYKLEK